MKEPLKLLAVFPHPDDESLGLGGTLARYAAEGVETYLICATRGERGWPGPPEQNPGFATLGRMREAELRCAATKLGLKEVTFLGYLDGDVDKADPRELIAVIALHICRIRPQVVITFAPDGGYGHPDHIALAQFTAGALVCAADVEYGSAHQQAPHRVDKFYHMVDTCSTVDTLQAEVGEFSFLVDGVRRSLVGWEEWAITTRVDTRAYFDQAWQAILCHESQLPGLGRLTELPREVLLRIWGEGTFVRIYSMANAGRKVEDDLFEGLR